MKEEAWLTLGVLGSEGDAGSGVTGTASLRESTVWDQTGAQQTFDLLCSHRKMCCHYLKSSGFPEIFLIVGWVVNCE